jgi:hypothetical protein
LILDGPCGRAVAAPVRFRVSGTQLARRRDNAFRSRALSGELLFESGIYFQCRGTFFTSITTCPNSITRAELPDKHAAWKEAIVMAGQTLQGLDGNLKPGCEWRMEVTDEFANPLYVLHINAERPK